MNQYPLWKNALVIIVILLGTLFALPNFYGEDPALIISKESGEIFNETELKDVEAFLLSRESSFTSVDNKTLSNVKTSSVIKIILLLQSFFHP